MPLQTDVDLLINKDLPGIQQSSGNASVTRSFSWQTDTSAMNYVLFGKFVARGSAPNEAVMLSASSKVEDILGVLVNDKYQQNPIGTYEASALINKDDSVDVLTFGSIGVQVSTNISFTDDIYVITSDAAHPENIGSLTNSATGGDTTLLIAGPTFATNTGGARGLIALFDNSAGGTNQAIECQINI